MGVNIDLDESEDRAPSLRYLNPHNFEESFNRHVQDIQNASQTKCSTKDYFYHEPGGGGVECISKEFCDQESVIHQCKEVLKDTRNCVIMVSEDTLTHCCTNHFTNYTKCVELGYEKTNPKLTFREIVKVDDGTYYKQSHVTIE